MKVLAGMGAMFGCLYLYRAYPIMIGMGNDTCIDYQDEDAPCWVSAIQLASYCFLAMLTVQVATRRLLASLYNKQKIGSPGSSRLEQLWRSWASWLIGFTIISTIFILPYLFYTTGRTFLLSTVGVIEILTTVEMALLGYLAFTETLRARFQSWLAQFGTVIDTMCLAALMSHGDMPLEELIDTAKVKLRYVTLSSMDRSEFVAGASSRLHRNFAKSVHGRPREIDLFVSHSWRDPPLERVNALLVVVENFKREVRLCDCS